MKLFCNCGSDGQTDKQTNKQKTNKQTGGLTIGLLVPSCVCIEKDSAEVLNISSTLHHLY